VEELDCSIIYNDGNRAHILALFSALATHRCSSRPPPISI